MSNIDLLFTWTGGKGIINIHGKEKEVKILPYKETCKMQ